MDAIVNKRFDQASGLGPRRLAIQLRQSFVGLGECRVRNVLAQNPASNLANIRFTNNVPITPIISKSVMGRIQIDVINMRRRPCKSSNGETYYYILSIIDIMSRFTWLTPLPRKSSQLIKSAANDIFEDFGYPKIVQHDQGTEFKGSFKKWLKEEAITDIQSSPYHPQSQGKVERLHRQLKKMIKYDTIKRGKLNWVNNLQLYTRKINDIPREELAWQSPFSVYFGRTKKYDIKCDLKTIRRKAIAATQRVNERTTKRQEKHLRVPIYRVGDTLFYKCNDKESRVSGNINVKTGVVIDTDLEHYKYLIEQEGGRQRWMSVRNLMGSTSVMQKERLTAADQNTNKRNIPSFHSTNFTVYNPVGDGNCQFNAIAHQLNQRFVDAYANAVGLRQDVVAYLREHEFLAEQETTRWSEMIPGNAEEYLMHMGEAGVFGDQVTLQAISELYRIQILVVSSLQDGSTLIRPDGGNVLDLNEPIIVLGHLAEGEGEHYLSLTPNSQEVVQQIAANSPQITLSEENGACSTYEEVSCNYHPEISTGSIVQVTAVKGER